jgi:2-dehydropantoate 2-reductase
VKVYIVGSGAVGTYLGGLLHGGLTEVTFAPRNHVDVTPVEADLAIVAVKSYDTPAAISTLRRALGTESEATILTPQNGVGNEERLAEAFGADRVVSCALTVPLEHASDGSITPSNDGGIALAPVGGSAHNWLIAALAQSGVPVTVTSDYRALKWSKLSLNIIANATCAILNVLPERMLRMEGMFGLELRAVRETGAVLRALGLPVLDLPRYPVRALYGAAALPEPLARVLLSSRIAGARGRKPPSLLLDLRAAKGETEAGVLNGAVAAAGRAHAIPVPVNAVLARVLTDIAQMPQLWAKYRERPAALLAEVRAEERRSGRARLHL